MLDILKDFYIDTIILLSTVLMAYALLKDKHARLSAAAVTLLGVAAGFFSCLMMVFGIRVAPGIIVDFRNIPLMLTAIYCNLPATMIVAVMIGAARMFLIGGQAGAVSAVFTALTNALLCGLIGRSKLDSRHQWIMATLGFLSVTFVALYFTLRDKGQFASIVAAYTIAHVIVLALLSQLLQKLKSDSILRAQLRLDSHNDPLTGLYNLRFFRNSLAELLAHARRHRQPLALLYMDIDYFKNINDTWGHDGGDRILTDVARMLKEHCRAADILSRNGGEEFSLLLPRCSATQAQAVAQRIREQIAGHDFYVAQAKAIHVTISIGVAAFPQHAADGQQLLQYADSALYDAKRVGRNAVCVYAEKCVPTPAATPYSVD